MPDYLSIALYTKVTDNSELSLLWQEKRPYQRATMKKMILASKTVSDVNSIMRDIISVL